MEQDEALQFMIHAFKEAQGNQFSKYGYGIYLPIVIAEYVYQTDDIPRTQVVDQSKIGELSPAFYAAAWELCRRGLIRPGITRYGEQATENGGSGDGYSLTPFGIMWLQEDHGDDYIPSDPNRFSQMLEPFQGLFGTGYFERGREAIRCYNANAYLACTAMCGAASESILLAAAVNIKSEDEVLSIYSSAGGRGRVEKLVFENTNTYIKRTYPGFTNLIKYWRDEAAHGQPSLISNDEAYTSLVILLKFSHFMKDHWQDIVEQTS